MIKINNLKAKIETDDGDVEILKGISLDIPADEIDTRRHPGEGRDP